MGLDNCKSKNEYLDMVANANDAGDISFFGESRVLHGHLSFGISETNTRRFEKVADALMKMASRDAEVLEMGAGAGVFASALTSRFPHASIDTIGLEPVNPYLRFGPSFSYLDKFMFIADRGILSAWAEIKRRFCEIDANHVKNVLKSEAGSICDFDDFFQLQKDLGLQVTALLDTPFIRHQFIGLFRESVCDRLGTYDLIVERYGPLYYQEYIECEILDSVIPKIKPKGAAIVTLDGQAVHDRVVGNRQFSEALKGEIATIYSNTVHGVALILRDGHPLHARAAHLVDETGSFKVHDLSEWVEDATALF